MEILYLAFCNSPTRPLPTLSREADTVHSILINRALRGDFVIHLDQHATIEKINRDLDKYRDRIALFLFSGHADRDALVMGEGDANAKGIAQQLGECPNLKLVVLNGCSTYGQVEDLKAAGVPAIISTNAPVNDTSATEFSIRFFANLSDKRMSIDAAYKGALGPAQTATKRNIRGIGFNPEITNPMAPLWDRFGAADFNPIPSRSSSAVALNYSPNDKLTDTLFKVLLEAGNEEIAELHRLESSKYVETGKKQTRIINVLPNPVGIHLQKLLCPIPEDQDGYDQPSLERLKQTGLLYHTTTEMLAWIMLSQLWELRLDDSFDNLPDDLLRKMDDFFFLSAEKRWVFDYIPFIRSIRQFFDTLNDNRGICYFVEELSHLKDLVAQEDHPFARACNYLHNLHNSVYKESIQKTNILDLCMESEERLCDFFKEMGFLHRYELTSIKSIDILRYRHDRKARFNHNMVPLMRATGTLEEQKYLFDEFIDNRGVVLIKWKHKPPRPVNPKSKQFEGGELTYLSLSPFLFDRYAFEMANLANLLAFEQFSPDSSIYQFKSVKKPYSPEDKAHIRMNGNFEGVHLQLEAFRNIILGKPK